MVQGHGRVSLVRETQRGENCVCDQIWAISEGLRFETCCQFLHKVLSLANQMTDIIPIVKRKLEFFENLMSSSKLKGSPVTAKLSFLQTINLLMRTLCREHRMRMCQFGEKHLVDVLGRLFFGHF